ncbi:response regulator [bacterium]
MFKIPLVLIIDDDESILDSCSQVFMKEGYKVITAEDGEKGLQKFREKEPDLVLVDLKMPGKNGMEVLEALRIVDPNCVSIVITGYGTIQSAVEAMKHGAFDFLPKPFTPDELRFIVRRGLERRRIILESESLRLEKEMMRRNFISMVSHELKAPLAAVQQNFIVLLEGMAGNIPENVDKILKRMYMRIKGLISLIGEWLNLSRIESGEMIVRMEETNIKAVLVDVVDMLQPLAEEKHVSLQLKIHNDVLSVLGDFETLKLLFTNIIHNGIKYNREGGHLDISSKIDDHEVKIFVKDTGIGIPQEKCPLIFEQFFRVKNGKDIEGSGLGLSIAKKIAEIHSGSIEVESKQGVGTMFTVSLPITKKY